MHDPGPEIVEEHAIRITPIHKLVEFSRPKSTLYLHGEALRMDLPTDMPGRWVRFWHKFLLGWEWRSIS
jgi:hypothetical protein